VEPTPRYSMLAMMSGDIVPTGRADSSMGIRGRMRGMASRLE
jgi:hypothetical protein